MKRILAIDDSNACMELMKRFSDIHNIDFYGTTSGSEFMKKIKKESWDLLIVDMHLPDCDPIEVLSKKKLGHTRLLIVTGYPEVLSAMTPEMETVWRSFFQKGNADILYKPFNHEDFLQAVLPLVEESNESYPLTQEQFHILTQARVCLAWHWLDLGKIKIRIENNNLEIAGKLQYLPDTPVRMTDKFTHLLKEQLQHIGNVGSVVISAEIQAQYRDENFELE